MRSTASAYVSSSPDDEGSVGVINRRSRNMKNVHTAWNLTAFQLSSWFKLKFVESRRRVYHRSDSFRAMQRELRSYRRLDQPNIDHRGASGRLSTMYIHAREVKNLSLHFSYSRHSRQPKASQFIRHRIIVRHRLRDDVKMRSRFPRNRVATRSRAFDRSRRDVPKLDVRSKFAERLVYLFTVRASAGERSCEMFLLERNKLTERYIRFSRETKQVRNRTTAFSVARAAGRRTCVPRKSVVFLFIVFSFFFSFITTEVNSSDERCHGRDREKRRKWDTLVPRLLLVRTLHVVAPRLGREVALVPRIVLLLVHRRFVAEMQKYRSTRQLSFAFFRCACNRYPAYDATLTFQQRCRSRDTIRDRRVAFSESQSFRCVSRSRAESRRSAITARCG